MKIYKKILIVFTILSGLYGILVVVNFARDAFNDASLVEFNTELEKMLGAFVFLGMRVLTVVISLYAIIIWAFINGLMWLLYIIANNIVRKNKKAIENNNGNEADSKYYYNDGKYRICNGDDCILIETDNTEYKVVYDRLSTNIYFEDEYGNRNRLNGHFDISYIIRCIKYNEKIRYRNTEVTVREFFDTMIRMMGVYACT